MFLPKVRIESVSSEVCKPWLHKVRLGCGRFHTMCEYYLLPEGLR